MSRGQSSGGGAISLDQLVALNDEMAALVRAGAPLEKGLTELGRDMPGRLGEIAAGLGQRMSAGESLAQILASDEKRFPPVWRAVVLAGLRSGRLSVALEGLSTTARRAAEVRRVVGVSLIYPLIVAGFAYVLFLVLVTRLTPVTLGAYEDLTLSSDPLLGWMASLGRAAKWWAIWPPAAAVLLVGYWRHRSSRAMFSQGSSTRRRSPGLLAQFWPPIRQVLRDGRMATFAETLSLLIRHETPLEEAVVLAADASGDKGLSRGARGVAERLRSGAAAVGLSADAPFPPLLGWVIAAGVREQLLSQTLLAMADTYRERAARAAAWRAVYLPILLTVAFGGTAVLIQALATFGPILRLLYRLAQPF